MEAGLGADDWNPLSQGAGHSVGGVNGATAGFLTCALILLILSSLFLGWRVYRGGKYLSKDWERV